MRNSEIYEAVSAKTAGFSSPLYYIYNGRFENVKRKSEIFQKNFLYSTKGKEP